MFVQNVGQRCIPQRHEMQKGKMMDETRETKRNVIRSIRKGSVQWSEEDRLKVATLLLKAGYAVKLNRQPIPGKASGKTQQMEYVIEYWEE